MENRTILVIDDEEQVCRLIKTLLEPEGFRVFPAYNGEEGLKILETMLPHLIILDMDMPKMGGVSFYTQLVNRKDSVSAIPVLVLTGRGNMQPFFEDLEIDGFMAKPFQPLELIETVKRILNKKS